MAKTPSPHPPTRPARRAALQTAEFLTSLEGAIAEERLSKRRSETRLELLEGMLQLVKVPPPPKAPGGRHCAVGGAAALSLGSSGDVTARLWRVGQSLREGIHTMLVRAPRAPRPQSATLKVDEDAKRLAAPADRLKKLLSAPKKETARWRPPESLRSRLAAAPAVGRGSPTHAPRRAASPYLCRSWRWRETTRSTHRWWRC